MYRPFFWASHHRKAIMVEKSVEEQYVVAAPSSLANGKKALILYNVKALNIRLAFAADRQTNKMAVGHVYMIPTTNEGKSIILARSQWVSVFEDEDWRREEVAKAEVFELARKRAVIEKDAKVDELERLIKPLRTLYWRLNSGDRLAFEMIVLNKLREYKIKDGKVVMP